MNTPQKSEILLLIPHLGGGGAERIIEILARYLNPAKFHVHLCLVTGNCPEHTHLPSFVAVHELGATSVRYSVFKILRLIWRIKPDVILSGMAHLNLLVLMLRPLMPRKSRIVVRQNGELATVLASRLCPWRSRAAYAAAYQRADRVICQTDPMAAEIKDQLNVRPHKLIVLCNPVVLRDVRRSTPHSQSQGPNILAIGRLVPEKGFDLLLEAFSALSNRYRKAQLIIAGTGPCERNLRQQAIALGIENQVRFIGYQTNTSELFRIASLFVLSSRSEGLPNALLEAAAAGLPIVATPACVGLVDLLKDKDGIWLAHATSSADLRSAMELAIADTPPGQRYPHNWIEIFDISHAIPAYEDAIDTVVQERR